MKVTVEKVGTRIYLRTPWSPGIPERCKSLGGRWSPKAKAWTYPLDIEMCRKFREEFGADLNIGPELWAWARNETEREKQLHAVGQVRDMDVMSTIALPRVQETNPGMWAAMTNRPYQPVASLYCAEAGQSLLADQPGVGKTIESLGALIEGKVKGNVLVVAPLKSTQAVWEPEIHRWMADYKDGYTVTRVSGMGKGKKLEQALSDFWEQRDNGLFPDGLHFLIINAEMARINHKGLTCPTGTCDGYQDWCPDLANHKGKREESHPWLFWTQGPRGGKKPRLWDAIIADETHKWLINTRGKSASQVGFGMAALKTTERNVRIAMTGTPLKGKKHNLFGTLNWLRPEVYKSKWRWVEDYFVVTDGDYGGKVIGDFRPDRKEAFDRSLNSIMIRRTKSELRKANPLWMPPDKQYHDVWVEMDAKQRKQYEQMERASRADLEGGLLEANGVLAEFTRLKQIAGSCGALENGTFKPMLPSAKFDWLIEFLEERGIERKVGGQRYGDLSDTVQKVVVASQFTSMIDVWLDELARLGIRATAITGKTKDALHEMQLFQSDPNYRVCLINTVAGGVSITLDAADDIVLMDETWVPDDQEQVEDRVHRASNVEHQVDVWYVRTKGTVEEAIAAVNIEKGESNHVVLDARRGLEYARRLREGA